MFLIKKIESMKEDLISEIKDLEDLSSQLRRDNTELESIVKELKQKLKETSVVQTTVDVAEPADSRNCAQVFPNPTSDQIKCRIQATLTDHKMHKNKTETKLEKSLTSKQVESLNFLINTTKNGSGCVLADRVGSGKSAVVLRLWETLHESARRMLILCPKTILQGWEAELNLWLTSDHGIQIYCIIDERVNPKHRISLINDWLNTNNILVMSYNTFCIASMQKNCKLLTPGPKVLVLDEGHKLKNSNTNLYQFVTQMSTQCKIALSATLAENKLSQLCEVLGAVQPSILKRKQLFLHRFRGLDSISGDKIQTQKTIFDVTSYILHRSSKAEEFRELKSEICVLLLKPTDLQKKLMDSYLTYVFSKNASQIQNNILEVNKNISWILTHPDIIYWKAKEAKKVSWCKFELDKYTSGDLKNGVKMQVLMRILDDCLQRQEKAIVYSYYTTTLDLIEKYLKAKQLSSFFLRVDGNTASSKARNKIFRRMNDAEDSHARILLLTSTAASEGVNLPGVTTTILMDVSWVASVDNQCMGRTVRLSQTKDTIVYRLVCDHSLDVYKLNRQSMENDLAICSSSPLSQEKSINSFDFLQNQDLFCLKTISRDSKFLPRHVQQLFNGLESCMSSKMLRQLNS